MLLLATQTISAQHLEWEGVTNLNGRTSRGDGSKEEDGRIFRLPVRLRVRCVLREVGTDVGCDDRSDLVLELLHERTGEV